MTRIVSIVCLLLANIVPLWAADYYASPNGSSTGSGSIDQPLDLATALSSTSPVKPGDTLWLRGGTYLGKFASSIAGTSSAQITVRSYPGEWAIIDSGVSDNRKNILQVSGGWVTFRDFEVMSSDPKRETTISGSWPDDIRRGEGVSVAAPSVKLINLVVHDASLGISAWSEGPNTEIYGCLIYHNGWQGPDRAHGHGIYSQNKDGHKWIHDNIVFNQFDKGVQVYGSSSASIKNFNIDGNVVFNSGALSFDGNVSENLLLYGGEGGPSGIVVKNNRFYGSNFQGKLVVGGENAQDLIFQGNYVPHLSRIRYWQTADVSQNTFVRATTLMELYHTSTWDSSRYFWDNNVYFSQELKYTPFGKFTLNSDGTISSKGLYFPGWQSETGFDTYSQYIKSRPPGAHVDVRPNKYEAGRAHVVIYNWDLADYVAVDLQGFLTVGQTFEVRNAQDFFAPPVLTGTYDGNPVQFPMTGLTVAQPVGLTAPASTAPEFAVFVLRTQGSSDSGSDGSTESPDSGTDSNTAPTISAIADQNTLEDTTLGPISFEIGDAETAPENLSVLASSSNPTLVPDSNLILSGTGNTRTITIHPAENQYGSATITIAVSDGVNVSKTSFLVTVESVNDSPTLIPPGNQKTHDGQSTPPIPFTVGDVETLADNLVVTARAANSKLVPPENIVLGGTGTDRTITITPAPNRYGKTTIYIRVSDGSATVEGQFEFISAR